MSLIGAFCVATVISAVVLAYYYSQAWHITKQRFAQAVAVVQGKPIESLIEKKEPAKAGPEGESEQPSYAQLQEAWALKTRDQELREQALRGEVDRMQRDRSSVSEDKKRLEQLYKTIVDTLDDRDKGEKAKGREENIAILESLKPKQAKELLAKMIERKEMDDVVVILSAMPESKRAKIIAEFKSPETDQIDDILRRIREGLPKTRAIEDMKKKVQSPSGTGQ